MFIKHQYGLLFKEKRILESKIAQIKRDLFKKLKDSGLTRYKSIKLSEEIVGKYELWWINQRMEKRA